MLHKRIIGMGKPSISTGWRPSLADGAGHGLGAERVQWAASAAVAELRDLELGMWRAQQAAWEVAGREGLTHCFRWNFGSSGSKHKHVGSPFTGRSNQMQRWDLAHSSVVEPSWVTGLLGCAAFPGLSALKAEAPQDEACSEHEWVPSQRLQELEHEGHDISPGKQAEGDSSLCQDDKETNKHMGRSCVTTHGSGKRTREPGAVLARKSRGCQEAGSGPGTQSLVARPWRAEGRRRAGHSQPGAHSHCARRRCTLIAHRVPARCIPWDCRVGAHRQDRAAAPPQRQSPDSHVSEPEHSSGELRSKGEEQWQWARFQRGPPDAPPRVICSFLGSCHAHIDGWHCSVLYSLESSRLSSGSCKSDKFFPALNTSVPGRGFLWVSYAPSILYQDARLCLQPCAFQAIERYLEKVKAIILDSAQGSVENGTFLELFPTSLSTSVDPSSGHLSNVYIYVSIFLSLLAFMLLLLIIALQRLKNIISSSSSYPEYPSDAGSSFTNLEVCSISSQRSTFSNLSS
ncbi:serine rich and transmembrane domain containing 1 [Cricetulus griseus]